MLQKMELTLKTMGIQHSHKSLILLGKVAIREMEQLDMMSCSRVCKGNNVRVIRRVEGGPEPVIFPVTSYFSSVVPVGPLRPKKADPVNEPQLELDPRDLGHVLVAQLPAESALQIAPGNTTQAVTQPGGTIRTK